MTRVLLYELASSGGHFLVPGGKLPPSIQREGRAMLAALAADFGSLAGVQTSLLCDTACPSDFSRTCATLRVASAAEHDELLASAAAAADWTLLVAPECNRYLLHLAERVLQAGGRLLGCSPRLIELCGDKHATCEHLAASGVQVPLGQILESEHSWPQALGYPQVVKPRDGAGSLGIQLLTESPPVGQRAALLGQRIERCVVGSAASMAVLCGPAGNVFLPAVTQRLASRDGAAGPDALAYLGGELPLAAALNGRADRLVRAAIAALPGPLGYLGVDLVLGDDRSGKDDTVIEINPRLTTSYVGLRAALEVNLAELMLAVAEGRLVDVPAPKHRVEFSADGRAWRV